jgi:hypothetical protein
LTRVAIAAVWLVLAGLTQQGASPATLKEDDVVFVDNNPATTTGLFHRQGCIWAARAWPTKITLKEARSRYFQAHCECVVGVKVPPPCPDTTPQQPTAGPSAAAPMAVEAPISSTPAKIVSTPAPRPAAAPAPARQQCAATTKKGTRCARLAAVGSAFCWQHGR